MSDLSELTFRTSYHKGRDDIAAEFYLPCMRRASGYDRAVGFFRSTVFTIAWPALKAFVQRGSKIRILCSRVLSATDIEALDKGYAARVDALLAAHFLEEVKSLMREEVLHAPTRVLAALVAQNILELKIAILSDAGTETASPRIFHDKLGIFRDAHRNVVIFKGSMNETWVGLAADGNLESIDVAASWMGARDLERTKSEDTYFQDLWSDHYPNLRVRPFPKVARDELEIARASDWESALEELLQQKHSTTHVQVKGRTLRPHQSSGLASWKANQRHGILAFATGSGKTFVAITAIREAIEHHKEVVVVVVPDRILFKQWYDELTKETQTLGVKILRAGSGYVRWRSELSRWSAPDGPPRILLATVQTASTRDFLSSLTGGSHLFLVADEVHRLGSVQNRSLLNDELFGARLGLSATPERAGDLVGTGAILAFFRGILEPRYTLADAVRDGVLTKYFYRPHVIHLSEEERESWQDISKQIARLQARIHSAAQTLPVADQLKGLLIRRARIVKQAAAKVPLAVQVLGAEFQPGQRWIVYCDDLAQLIKVSEALLRIGLSNLPFHSKMEGSRVETLKWLDRRGGIVVAIKCLDEGVDIPSVTHALILASSKNQGNSSSAAVGY